MKPSSARQKENGHYIFRPYITIKGRRVYPVKSRVFKIWIKD